MKIIFTITVVSLIGVMLNSTLQAQELEPRALTNTPVGMNFAIIGYG